MDLCRSPLRAGSPFPKVQWFSWTQSPLIFKTRHFGGSPFHCWTQGWGFLMWAHSLHSLRESFGIPPDCGSPFLGWGLRWDHVSALLLTQMHLFYPCCRSTLHLVLRSFLEENYSIYSFKFVVSWKEVSSGSSYAAILNPVSLSLSFIIMFHGPCMLSQKARFPSFYN